MSDHIAPLFNAILQAHGCVPLPAMPKPTQTIRVMEAILSGHLDAAERLEGDIAELETDLRYPCNDWTKQSTILKLTDARAELTHHVARAAETLRTIGVLREKAGLDAHVLTRIMLEFNSTSTKES